MSFMDSNLNGAEQLAFANEAMQGTWAGRADSPWTAPWQLTLVFRRDGTYSAHAADPANNLAFYYGTDKDCAMKRWRPEGAHFDGFFGEIDIGFDYGQTDCGAPSWQGLFEQVLTNAERTRLRFWFRTGDGYGPVKYDLFRVCK
jgi:hypothetical protein